MKEYGTILRSLKASARCTVIACLLCGVLSTKSGAMLQVIASTTSDSGERQYEKCQAAAKDALGGRAEVLRCGTLNNPGILEVVAAIRKEPLRRGVTDIFVSQLVVLRQGRSGWDRALTVSHQVSNSAGYIGIDYIDDSARLWGYAVQFHDHRADGKAAFVLSLRYMSSEKDTDEFPDDVAWNETVGRYEEFSMNNEPLGFKPELKNPPHH